MSTTRATSGLLKDLYAELKKTTKRAAYKKLIVQYQEAKGVRELETLFFDHDDKPVSEGLVLQREGGKYTKYGEPPTPVTYALGKPSMTSGATVPSPMKVWTEVPSHDEVKALLKQHFEMG